MRTIIGLLAFVSMMSFARATETIPAFRTPAKRYGSSYSVKITLQRDGFTYDIPVWVKPDQKTSTLDHDQLTELGWNYPDIRPEDITMSEESLENPKFRNEKSEWAYVPDFARSCCYGIIGQDILKDFEIRFDPNPPSHLEWTRITPDPKKKIKAKLAFQKELALLFSLHSTHATFGKEKIDLSTTPYRLNIDEQVLSFEQPYVNPKGLPKPLASKIFQYTFIPPSREVLVISLPHTYMKSAKEVGFKSSMKIEQINQIKVAALDHFELDDFLTGKRTKQIVLATEKGKYTFDFEKNEFTQFEKIPSPPRRK